MLEFIKAHKTGIIAVTVAAVATIAIILAGAKIYKHNKHNNANQTNTSSVSSNPEDDFYMIDVSEREPEESPKVKKARTQFENAENHLTNAQQQFNRNPNAKNKANLRNAKEGVASSKNTLNQLKNNENQKRISNSKLPRNMQSRNNGKKNKNVAASGSRPNQKPKSKK